VDKFNEIVQVVDKNAFIPCYDLHTSLSAISLRIIFPYFVSEKEINHFISVPHKIREVIR